MKAKLSIKKALSLIVALVMLLTMIPVGMISVSADEPTIDLSDYEFTSEYVIMNVEDWILIAREAQDKDFSGKTVKLGADLDFGAYTSIWDEAHVPLDAEFPNAQFDGTKPGSGQEIAREYAATVPTLFTNFAGIFDGQDYTISNARFEESAIAKKALDGAEIDNVKFDNVTLTDYYDYFAYGLVAGEVVGSFWMENVHVTNSELFGNSFNTFHFGSAGALIGLISAAEGIEDAYVYVGDCSVDAQVACGNYKGWGYGYGTGLLIGTIDANVDVDVSYCEVSGSITTIDWYAGAIGATYVGKGKTVNINNILINNVDIFSARGAVTEGSQSLGALTGCISMNDDASVTVDRITVTNTSIQSNAHAVAGLVGHLGVLNSPADNGGPVGNNTAGSNGAGRIYTRESVEGTHAEISNIYIDAFLWANTKTGGGQGAAGLIGQIGEGNNSGDSVGRIMDGEFNIYNVYVGGTIVCGLYNEATETWTVQQGAGGLFFNVSLAEITVNVSNAIIDAAFPVNTQYVEAPANLDALLEGLAAGDAAAKATLEAYSSRKTGAVMKCVGLIANAGTIRQKTTGDYIGGEDKYLEAYVNVSDVATTLRGDFNLFCWLNRKGGITYNGTDIGRGDDVAYAPPVENTDGAIVQVRPNEAKQMVQLDENGFVSKVTGALAPVAVQAAGDDVRFIALAYVDNIATATATVTFVDNNTFAEKTFTFETVSVYDALTAVEGTDIAEYDATDFFAKKLMAVTIKGIPADAEYTVAWSFAYTTTEGTVVTSETATGIYADGALTLN